MSAGQAAPEKLRCEGMRSAVECHALLERPIFVQHIARSLSRRRSGFNTLRTCAWSRRRTDLHLNGDEVDAERVFGDRERP